MRKKEKKTAFKKSYLFLMLFATLFMGIGYASINSVILNITGSTFAYGHDGVLITEFKYYSDSNANLENTEVLNVYNTMFNSKVTLSDSYPKSSITYAITVRNSLDEIYYYTGPSYEKEFYDNDDITFEITGIEKYEALNSKSSKTFYITFKYIDKYADSLEEEPKVPEVQTLNSYINFVFKPAYNIKYVNIANNNLTKIAVVEEPLTITFKDSIVSEIEVYIDDVLTTDYTYTNNVFHMDSVTGNLKIVGAIEEPNLLENNLVPVIYDGEDWVVADITNEWFNYGNQEWANAIALDDSSSLQTGDIVDVENDIRGMFVWIPRYEYKIATDGSNEVFVNFISTDQTTASSGYIIPPAFEFGTTQLDGIWVGKFETSVSKTSSCYTSTTSSNCNNTDLDLYVIPNAMSVREQTISTQFTLAQNFSDIFTSSSIDSHMLKNSEWALVAYLSNSQYGKYGNQNYTDSNKEIYVNSSADLFTGKSSGSPSYDEATLYSYNHGMSGNTFISEENGIGASTTGNITGIYDMNGGTYEYVMGYLTTASSTFGATSVYDYADFSTTPNSKYYDNYTSTSLSSACSGSACSGHAFQETAGWYNDAASFLTTTDPWVMRGGVFDAGEGSGIFAYVGTLGYSGAYATFRMALVLEN